MAGRCPQREPVRHGSLRSAHPVGSAAHRHRHARTAREPSPPGRPLPGAGSATSRRRGWRCGSPTPRRSRRPAASRSCCPRTASSTTRRRSLDRLDGLIFSGGPDLDPAIYGQAPHPRLGPDVDRVGDEYELALLAVAAERDLPVLGSAAGCRRSTSRAAARCTSISRTAPSSSTTRAARPSSRRTPSRSRADRCSTGSPATELEVNSFHHQAVDRFGEACGSAPSRTTPRSRPCGTQPPDSASACSGTRRCSRIAPSTPACSRALVSAARRCRAGAAARRLSFRLLARGRCPPGGRPGLQLLSGEETVDELDRDRPLPHRGGHPLDGSMPHIARCEHPGHARFERAEAGARAANRLPRRRP